MRTISRPWLAPAKHPYKLIIATKAEWLGLSGVIALGAALRWWSHAMKSDLWYDEMYSYLVAGREFSSMMNILYSGADTNPPLYTLLLHYWLKLGTSDTHVKCLSLLFAIASIG